jgi:Transglycosylase SLT domain
MCAASQHLRATSRRVEQTDRRGSECIAGGPAGVRQQGDVALRLLPSVLAMSVLAATPSAMAARSSAGSAIDPGQLCRRAILLAEREHRLPTALLHAIAQVEAGRPDPRTGAAVSWPWTVNAEGQGRFFETKEGAIAAVRALQARGVSVIDVGCLQVNLHHHPRAFASLEEAFDPVANARYAGLFLTRLHQGTGNWERAAAHYHSQTPELAEAYRRKVLAAWPGMAQRLAAERQREAMISAWGGGDTAPAVPSMTGAEGFQAVALSLSRQGSRAAAGRGLLDPLPVQAAAPPGRRTNPPRRPRLQELAEAPRRR